MKMNIEAYLQRRGERLVVQGLRHWLSGFEFRDTACWEQAWALYTEELGALGAGALITHLHLWLQKIRETATEPLNCLTCQCRFLCRSECLCLAMIAALQHNDGTTAEVCARALIGQETAPVLEAAGSFAACLAQHDARLLEIPLSVALSIIEGGRKPIRTLN
jgi:hypothetical protein